MGARPTPLVDSRNQGTCRLVAVSRRSDCARPARLSARVNSPHGGAIRRINDIVTTEKGRQRAAVFNHASTSHPIAPARGDVDARMRARGEKARGYDDPCVPARRCLWRPNLGGEMSPRLHTSSLGKGRGAASGDRCVLLLKCPAT